MMMHRSDSMEINGKEWFTYSDITWTPYTEKDYCLLSQTPLLNEMQCFMWIEKDGKPFSNLISGIYYYNQLDWYDVPENAPILSSLTERTMLIYDFLIDYRDYFKDTYVQRYVSLEKYYDLELPDKISNTAEIFKNSGYDYLFLDKLAHLKKIRDVYVFSLVYPNLFNVNLNYK